MRNRILNVTADGNWQTLGPAENFPQNTFTIVVQARAANAVNVRFVGQTSYWTVKAGAVRTFVGKFDPGDFQIQGTNNDVIEIECNTARTLAGLA